jgi:RNA polymerase-associated protein RTF1
MSAATISPSDDEDDDEFVYKYGEDLLGDEGDRAYVDGLTEMDRELIMSERYEEREDAKERHDLMVKKKAKKREEEDASIPVKSSRGRKANKEDAKTKQVLAELKARRQKKKAEEAEDEEEPEEEAEMDDDESESENEYGSSKKKKKKKSKKGKGKTGSKSRAVVDDEEEEEEWDDDSGRKGGRRGSRSRGQLVGDDSEDEARDSDASDDSDAGTGKSKGLPASLEQIQKIRLSRHRMEHWVHEPFLAEVVVGCFVRIGIGTGKDGNQVYKCAEITGVEDGSAYTLGNTRTRKRIKLKHGVEEKLFKMASISNADFTPQEFARWKADMEDHSLRVINEKGVAKKEAVILKFKMKEHTGSDVKAILDEKRRAGVVKGNTEYQSKQVELEIEAFEDKRQRAQAAYDELRAEEYARKIEEKTAEKEELMRISELRRQRRFGNGTSLNVAKINARNIGTNFKVRDMQAKDAEKGSKAKAIVVANEKAATALTTHKNSIVALNNAHADLDIDIDLDMDLPDDLESMVRTGSKPAAKTAAPRGRGLDLSAFKQARGLI